MPCITIPRKKPSSTLSDGVRDIRKGLLKSVLPLKTSFVEDPVRMLRAVKYAAITGMKISPPVGRRIRKDSNLLATASVSRLSEELYKILDSRNSETILRLMDRYRLLEHLLPGFAEVFRIQEGQSGPSGSHLSQSCQTRSDDAHQRCRSMPDDQAPL